MFVSPDLPWNILLKCEQKIESGVRQDIYILFPFCKKTEISSNNIEALLRQKRNFRRLLQEFCSPRLKSQLNQRQRLLREALQKNKESNLQKYLWNLDAMKD